MVKLHWHNRSFYTPEVAAFQYQLSHTSRVHLCVRALDWWKVSSHQCYLIHIAQGPGSVISKNAHLDLLHLPGYLQSLCYNPLPLAPTQETRWRACWRCIFISKGLASSPLLEGVSCASGSCLFSFSAAHLLISFNSFASKGHFKVMPLLKKRHLMETHVS